MSSDLKDEDFIHKMLKEIKDNKIPSYLIPKCPICRKEMTTNIRCDDKFVKDDGWHKAAKNYQNFLEDNKNKKILFLELGVGWNNPVIIKYPFIRMTHQFNNAYYACINKGNNYVPDESDMLPPLIEVGASRSRILPNPVSTS
ncbi:MAG: hypothetical protein SPJ52_04405 [Candidatus Enterosoma sp.]|nr:hypothetical protein [bacterium]MDY5866364.1 hypothetical protein [Candidatus Enterosoma sp.]